MRQDVRRFRVKHTVSDEVTIDARDVDLMRGKWYLRVTYGRASAFHFEEGPDGKERKRSLHQIIAERHIPRPSPEHTVVEALDGNKLNCSASNLEWRRRDDTDFKRKRAGVEPAEKPEPTHDERRDALFAKLERYEARKREYDAWQAEQLKSTRR